MIDDRLIAKAESLAGGEVHTVVTLICLYEGQYQISLLEKTQKAKDMCLKRMEVCEQALRMFVAGKPARSCDEWLRVELAKHPLP